MSHDTDTTDATAIARRLTEWVVELMPGCDPSSIGYDTPLKQFAGFDSIAIVQLLARAEDAYDVELADQDSAIESASSVRALTETLLRLVGDQR